MNNLLQLKGQFHLNGNHTAGFHPSIGKNIITVDTLHNLSAEISYIRKRWEKDTVIKGALFSTHYKRVVPKTKRVNYLFRFGKTSANQTVVGARFDEKKHVITHFMPIEALQRAERKLIAASEIVKQFFPNGFSQQDLAAVFSGEKRIPFKELKKSAFISIMQDICEVEYFSIDQFEMPTNFQYYIVTFYQTGKPATELLLNINIDVTVNKTIYKNVFILEKSELERVIEFYPYLVSQALTDFNALTPEAHISVFDRNLTIPKPGNEPVIGVLDTGFDDDVYFHEWVEVHNMLTEGIEIHQKDKRHGTGVSSIIVDGPSLNPKLDDHCGRFRVRHFCIATANKFDSYLIGSKLEQIIKGNPDIKVWNLSLGSPLSTSPNYISPIAAIIDKIQVDYDVVFVIAGTNYSPRFPNETKVGSPADSLNAVVVNSAKMNGEPASYTRTGPVLSFFNKPDVSYYGGDDDELIEVFEPSGICRISGTSYAAPWVARKLAYLICKLKLSKEVAKALIIDSAAKWATGSSISVEQGFGVVPIKIEDVIEAQDDEIRFILDGNVEDYETYTYNLPVPTDKNAFPYYARATLCYFPECERAQGVDYTGTELDFKFGRVKINKRGKAEIDPINKNYQSLADHYTYEADARKLFRKWDNVKRVSEEIKSRAIPRKIYEEGMWGLSLISKERLHPEKRYGMHFGIVITLKEMKGQNRIQEFVKLCFAKGWLVNEIDITVMNRIYNLEEEEIEFE